MLTLLSLLSLSNDIQDLVPETAENTSGAGDSFFGSGQWQSILMLVAIFAVMWFFMIRPQRKQQKELAKFRDGLKKGDKVVTIGGIYGTVAEVKENNLLIEIDKDVKIRVAKSSVVKDFEESQK